MTDQYLFVHIPKTAGQSIQRQLGDRCICFDHTKAKDIQVLRDFPSFSVVRNPYDRLLSTFTFYRQNYKGDREIKEIMQSFRNFKEFILNLNEVDDHQLDTQFSYLADNNGDILVDDVLRFEGLKYDFYAKFGEDLRYNLNTSRHWEYRAIYTDDMRQIVADRYEVDFNKFRYLI